MTALTKNTMRLESLASELSSGTAEETQQKSGQRNVVSRFFGGSKEELIEEKEIETTEEQREKSKQEHSQPSVPFRNPFARKQGFERKDSNKVLLQEVSSDSLAVDSEGIDEEQVGSGLEPEPTKVSIPILSSTSSETSGSSASQNQPSTNISHKASPFSGFGAALNISLNKPPNSNNRNPFARFGNLTSNPATKKNENKVAGMGNHFAGLHQFRKNTMAVMTTAENKNTQSRPTTEMEQDSGKPTETSVNSSVFPQESDIAKGEVQEHGDTSSQPPTPHIAKV
jgi:hypothetical protein